MKKKIIDRLRVTTYRELKEALGTSGELLNVII